MACKIVILTLERRSLIIPIHFQIEFYGNYWWDCCNSWDFNAVVESIYSETLDNQILHLGDLSQSYFVDWILNFFLFQMESFCTLCAWNAKLPKVIWGKPTTGRAPCHFMIAVTCSHIKFVVSVHCAIFCCQMFHVNNPNL